MIFHSHPKVLLILCLKEHAWRYKLKEHAWRYKLYPTPFDNEKVARKGNTAPESDGTPPADLRYMLSSKDAFSVQFMGCACIPRGRMYMHGSVHFPAQLRIRGFGFSFWGVQFALWLLRMRCGSRATFVQQ